MAELGLGHRQPEGQQPARLLLALLLHGECPKAPGVSLGTPEMLQKSGSPVPRPSPSSGAEGRTGCQGSQEMQEGGTRQDAAAQGDQFRREVLMCKGAMIPASHHSHHSRGFPQGDREVG